MIIQIRGTSGSGKTWVMRQMFLSRKFEPIYTTGRKKPVAYMNVDDQIYIMGHYESPCGGCDNIGSAAEVYNTIQAMRLPLFPTILCEGLLLSEDVKWTSKLAEGTKVKTLFLTTPVEQCLDQIRSRRKEAGNEKELKTHNTTNRVAVIERARVRLEEAGVYCQRCSANQAPFIINKWIKEFRNAERTRLG